MWPTARKTLSKAADWGWLILIAIGIFQGDFRWYGFAMLWGGPRLIVMRIEANKPVAAATTLQTTASDLVSERAIESEKLKSLVSATGIVLMLGGLALIYIFDRYEGMERALVELCEHREEIDWDSQPRMTLEFNEACSWTEYRDDDYY